jgi:hypothetical protein
MMTLLADKLGTLSPPTDAFSAGSDTGAGAGLNLETFISNAIGAITITAGLFFVFYFVMGGLTWVTAGGEKGKLEKARDQMFQGVTGMIIIVISYGLIGIIGGFLGLDILNPATVITKFLHP